MSTYALSGEIKFPAHKGRQKFSIRRFTECKIESSWQSLTDTAEITIPRKVKDFNRMKLSEWFREGDPVEIWLGYDGNLVLEFQGYVKTVSAGIPVVITFEDEMYKLKRNKVNISLKNCTLKELLQAIAPGYEIDCDETKIVGTFRFSNKSAGQCLEELKSKQNINCYFDGKVLHAADAMSREGLSVIDVLLERTAEESLKQKAVEEILVICELIRSRGKKLTAEFGDKESGNISRFTYTGEQNYTMSELKERAEKLYNSFKTPGLDGDVTLFGDISVRHGMKLNLSSALYSEKNGIYYIDAVTKTMTPQGYRQSCKLGDKAV